MFFLKRLRIKKKYNRILPFGDYFVDRWKKAQFAGFGSGSSVYDSCLILGDVKMGSNCWVGPYTILDGSGGGLEIGDNCHISSGVHIYTHSTVNKVIHGTEIEYAPVKIGNNVYIGPNSIISRGVTIGDQVVIGALSFVNKSIPERHKAYGSPAQFYQIESSEKFS